MAWSDKKDPNLNTHMKTINLVMAWQSSACTSPLEKVVLNLTSRSLPEKLSNV